MTRSSFPSSIDEFILNTEISASDRPLVLRFQELKMKLVRTPQEDDELTALTIALRSKLMSAEDYNHMKDAIRATQIFFRDNVDGYIQEKQVEFDLELDKFKDMGDYSPIVSYKKRNTVRYNGETYLALTDNINTLPTNTSVWSKIAQRGEKGEQGLAGIGLNYRGDWVANRQYNVNEAVTFAGQIYACLQTNFGIEPQSSSSAYWSLAVTKGGSSKLTTYKKTVTFSSLSSLVNINIPEYNSSEDTLLVFKNSTTLAEGINYKINTLGNAIESLDGEWDGRTHPITFHFIVFKNAMSSFAFGDGAFIQDNTIHKSKLKPELRTEIENGKVVFSNTAPTNKTSLWVDLNEL